MASQKLLDRPATFAEDFTGCSTVAEIEKHIAQNANFIKLKYDCIKRLSPEYINILRAIGQPSSAIGCRLVFESFHALQWTLLFLEDIKQREMEVEIPLARQLCPFEVQPLDEKQCEELYGNLEQWAVTKNGGPTARLVVVGVQFKATDVVGAGFYCLSVSSWT
jgi:hypothetical protein